jgi:hypothetical protein
MKWNGMSWNTFLVYFLVILSLLQNLQLPLEWVSLAESCLWPVAFRFWFVLPSTSLTLFWEQQILNKGSFVPTFVSCHIKCHLSLTYMHRTSRKSDSDQCEQMGSLDHPLVSMESWEGTGKYRWGKTASSSLSWYLHRPSLICLRRGTLREWHGLVRCESGCDDIPPP